MALPLLGSPKCPRHLGGIQRHPIRLLRLWIRQYPKDCYTLAANDHSLKKTRFEGLFAGANQSPPFASCHSHAAFYSHSDYLRLARHFFSLNRNLVCGSWEEL